MAEKAYYLEKAKAEKDGTDTVSYTLDHLYKLNNLAGFQENVIQQY